jgi:hypothetical protein
VFTVLLTRFLAGFSLSHSSANTHDIRPVVVGRLFCGLGVSVLFGQGELDLKSF